jgi:predicted ATPase
MNKLILISGCSGGGKSTLLNALREREFATVEEPGRRVVAAEQTRGGDALPWRDMEAFLRRTLALAIEDFEAARDMAGPVFFDRGIIDALSGLQHLTGRAPEDAARRYRYAETVFLAPPWPEIYETDSARKHGLDEALAEYDRLAAAFPEFGYRTQILPKIPVADRADHILSTLQLG